MQDEEMKFPCMNKDFDYKRKSKVEAIDDCDYCCEKCGFNPAVSKARLDNGHWIENSVMAVNKFDESLNYQKVIETSFIGGLKQLVFPSGIEVKA